MAPSYLLDTSALAAHFLEEPGGVFVAACAARHGLVLLHCDSHYAALPASVAAIDIRSV